MKYAYQQHEQQETGYQQEHLLAETPVRISNQPQFSPVPPYNDAHLASALCYSIGWLTGLLFLLFTRQNQFVRYHALQALLFFGGINIIDIAIFNIAIFGTRFHILPFSGFSLFLLFLFFMLLQLVAFVGWIISMFQAARGAYYQLPFVGGLAARFIGRGMPL